MTPQRFTALALGLAAFGLLAGCQTTRVPSEVLEPKGELKAHEPEGAQSVDEATAARLLLEARYREGMDLYAAGDKDKGLAILREVADKCKAEKITLPVAMDTKLKAALSGAPVPALVTASAPTPPAPAPAPVEKPAPPPEPPKPAPEAPAPPAAPEPEMRLPALTDPAMADQLISVDFNQVDIRVVIKTISDITGLNFLVDDNVKGNVTLISPTKVRLGEVYKVLESILDVKGFAAVPSGNVIKILQRSAVTKRSVGIRIGEDPSRMSSGDTVVTQIIPLRYATASDITTLIQPLIGDGDLLAAYAPTNTLVLTGVSSNIRRIAEIIKTMDLPGAQQEVFVIALKYANCTDLSQQILQMLEKDAGVSIASSGGASREAPAPVGVIRGAMPPAAATPAGSSPAAKSVLKIIPDTRTNSLVILANAKTAQVIRDIVARLDVQRPIDSGNIHVVYLENAEAKDAAKSLSAALEASAKAGGAQKSETVRVTADESTNSLLIIASPEDFRVVGDIIAKLDIVREQVLVELRIIEANDEIVRSIGADWSTLDQASASGVRGFTGTNLGVRSAYTSASGLGGISAGAFKKVGDTTQIGAIINLLENTSGVNVLSTPKVLTINHHEATIKVTDNVPYLKQGQITNTEPSAPTVINTYDYKDVGVVMKLKPHISHGGMVRMEINSSFSKIAPNPSGAASGTITTSTRETDTVVTIPSGNTVVIGGLIGDSKTTTIQKVPVLADIPYLGAIFRYKSDDFVKTDLLIFITPYVLAGKAASVVDPGQSLPTAETVREHKYEAIPR